MRPLALVCLLLIAPCVSALELGGIALPDRLEVGTTALTLNGAGIREKYFLDLYVGGLYLPAASQDARAIMDADTPMALRLHIISGRITSERMTESTLEGFAHATRGNTAPIAAEIESFLGSFRAPIREGDVFDMRYAPGTGVTVFKNGKQERVIAGLAFKRALFGIWLCDEPAQASLRDALLGRD